MVVGRITGTGLPRLRGVFLIAGAVVAAGILFCVLRVSAGGICEDVAADLPECICFLDPIGGPGEWPPLLAGAASRDIHQVANRTKGAITSCKEAGGQPYWQMQLQLFGPITARDAAVADPDMIPESPREAWCTETIAYWHEFANRPYFNGYVAPWHESKYVKHTRELREWYQTGANSGGRARWIDGCQFDQANFMPGINGPCPGAYTQWESWDSLCIFGECFGLFVWQGPGSAHSQMVDSMVICTDPAGTIRQVDLFIVDGNTGRGWAGFVSAGSQTDAETGEIFGSTWVTDKWYTDISRYLVYSAFDDTIRESKIRGWGIDLDAAGNPMYDATRIRTEVGPYFRPQAPPPTTCVDSSDTAMANRFSVYYSQSGYTKAVTSNSTMVQHFSKLPNDSAGKWVIPSGPHPTGSFVEINVDLLADHPQPVRGIVVEWKNGVIPPYWEVWWSASNVQIHTKSITMSTGFSPDPNTTVIPYHVRFGPGPDTTYTVRYTKLRIPNPVPATYEVVGFHYLFYNKPEEDGDSLWFDPVGPCECGSSQDPHGDITRDGRYDILDVVANIGIAFRGNLMHPNAPTCPRNRSDLNCDGVIDILDVVKIVDVSFRGANIATTICNPCATM